MSKLDFNKPIMTSDGRAVRILCRDRQDSKYPIVALVTSHKGGEVPYTYTAEGTNYAFIGGAQLINPPWEVTRFEIFNTQTEEPLGYSHSSREGAEAYKQRWGYTSENYQVVEMRGKIT